MTIEEVKTMVESHPDSYVQIIKARNRKFYDEILTTYTGVKFGERLYRYVNSSDSTIGTCKQCGANTKFMSFIVGFTTYCGKKCSNSATAKSRAESLIETNKKTHHIYYDKINCAICGVEFEALKYREQKCCSGKCSGILVASYPDRMSKIKTTKLEKYGSENYVNPDKARETCLEKYGVDNVFKSDEIKEKIYATNLKLYGSNNYFSSDIGKSTVKNEIKRKYGVDNVSQSESVKLTVKQTFNRNYGVDNIFQHIPTMDKVYASNIVKYGSKIPVNGESMRKLAMEKMHQSSYEKVISRINSKCEVTPMFSLSEYKDTYRTNIYEFACKKCGVEFNDHIDGGHLPRCLLCDPFIAGFSAAEREISEYISSLVGVDNVIENDRTILDGKELDIYIPSKNIAIEFNGLYWHGEFSGGKDRHYHLDKTNKCSERGIQLIHIFEDEWNDKKDILKNKLAHILHTPIEPVRSIFARKCVIKEINDCAEFLNQTHIQGNCPASIKLGAYHEDKLVAVMTFGKNRVAMGKKSTAVGEYELLRFSTNCNVVGIAGKLLKYFIQLHNPIKIHTYADKRYSKGNLYNSIGFRYTGDSTPNYWYFVSGETRRWHRFNFRKDQLSKKLAKFDINLTEWENMKNNGYDRIWDCGNMRYEWDRS